MNSIIPPLLILLLAFSGLPHNTPGAPRNHLLNSAGNIIISKNYYLLSQFQTNKGVTEMLRRDTALARLLKEKYQQVQLALRECKTTPACFTDKLQFNDAEIKKISQILVGMYSPGNALAKLVDQVKTSHCYIQNENLSGLDFLIKSWEQDARGINFVIAVYGAGNKPNYPLIDSISFNVNDQRYTSLLYNALYALESEQDKTNLFFSLSLRAALLFLEINDRNNAGDYEPLDKVENKTASDRVNFINWSRYKYSVILVPGAGPDLPDVSLSAEGMIRCRLAAMEFHKGLAPFILVSGGKVHPYKTKYCEAIEMKKYLVEQLRIPTNAIFIDPHARHTTTNMRNAARLIYRYGLPFSMPGLSCTTRGQSNMIETTLPARCEKELSELPYRNGKRLSETLAEFYPQLEAMQINPFEPMDP